MYQQSYSHQHGIRDESRPRPRQPSSTSSTLLTPSEGSDAWMPTSRSGVRGNTSTTTGTSQSIFSDGEDHDTYKEEEGDEVTEVGTVDMPKLRSNYEPEENKEDEDRPLIDFGQQPERLDQVGEPMPTPGDKLRMLLRQMEAEVRRTTPAPAPTPVLITAPTPRHARRPSIPRDISEDEKETPVTAPKSHWREGRRIGALPKERSYSPIASPERPIARTNTEEFEQEEEMEVLEDSPPTPPLRITNPYLYNNRKSEERRSISPRISSRAAVLHASTSRSPDPPNLHQPTPLESYLARTPASTSPSRKGKERALDYTPQRTSPSASTSRTTIKTRSTKTPRKWSVELAPDDSILFAEGIPAETEQVELDVDESVEPPWEDTDDASASGSGSDSEGSPKKSFATARDGRSRTIAFESPEISLPALPEIQASFGSSSGEEEVEMVPTIARPTSRTRSRYSQSRSHEDSLLAQSNARSLRQSQPPTRQSPSKTINQSTSFTTAKSTSPSFRLNRSNRLPPPVKAVFPQDIQVGMSFTPAPTLPSTSTPPRIERPQAQVQPTPAGQTPRPPGAWFSASKSQARGRRDSKFVPSPSPLRHRSSPPTQGAGDTSIHRIKLSPARTRPTSASTNSGKGKEKEKEAEAEEEGDISITQRLISLSKSLSLTSRKQTRIPKPSTTLIEARLALARAAEASAIAQRKVESSQKDWLAALSSGTAVDVIKQGWSWGKWAWWITMEILLLWGVFRVTIEYASMAQFRPFPFDPTGPSLALSVPLPTAVSAFIIPDRHRGNVNFFDLLENFELWRFLGLGVVGFDDPGGSGRLLIPV